MDKFVKVVTVAAMCVVWGWAQDIIYLCGGGEIKGKVLQGLNMGNVEYVSSSGENSYVSFAEVAKIQYSNGHLVNYVLSGRSENQCANATAERIASGQSARERATTEQAYRYKSSTEQTTAQQQIETSKDDGMSFWGWAGITVAGAGGTMMSTGIKNRDGATIGIGAGFAVGGLALALIADLADIIKKNARAKRAAEHVQIGASLDGDYYAGVRFDF
ncbi:MAG: hypothetical protein FWF51_02700 [Chitinivibrionia bacterium]|nr:hypothetical protein [Chitinivibrionia bacterium]